jgi:hypothetical protein
MADSQAGFPSQEKGTNPTTGKRGSNQFLVGNSHGDDPTKLPRANRVQPGQLPKTSGPAFGAPTKVNPLGQNFPASME